MNWASTTWTIRTTTTKGGAYNSLTQEQVDAHLHVMVVDRQLFEYKNQCYNAIVLADPYNEEGVLQYLFELVHALLPQNKSTKPNGP